ncbi:Scr1 family TA system antitoxin-like transcriptional regulator [Kitasatospora sp. NPDC059817]|uniref:Scr1 family TA system antitoxin-like transcriptional regulator n=1 Tax=Kitasatospora sp. NPDC059817 TaxID=3346961 RepID=UPI003660C261
MEPPPAPVSNGDLRSAPDPGGWARHRLGAWLIGLHLRHLRTCQGATLRELQERLPAASPAGMRGVSLSAFSRIETGEGRTLELAAAKGRLVDYLHAYGVDRGLAGADLTQMVQDLPLREPHRYFDSGPGWTQRVDLATQEATNVLLWAPLVIPPSLRIPAYHRAAIANAPLIGGVWGDTAPADLRTLPGPGCDACRAYRSPAIDDPGGGPMVAAYFQAVTRNRRAAFETRIAEPRPTAAVLLSEAVLHLQTGGPDVHARQLRYLARLVRDTALDLRIHPLSRPLALPPHHTAYLGYRTGTVICVEEQRAASYIAATGDRRSDLSDPYQALERAATPQESVRLLYRAADALTEGRVVTHDVLYGDPDGRTPDIYGSARRPASVADRAALDRG